MTLMDQKNNVSDASDTKEHRAEVNNAIQESKNNVAKFGKVNDTSFASV